MNKCPENLVHEQEPIDSAQRIFHDTALQAKSLGFEFCSYYARIPFPVSRPSTFTFNNHPPIWNSAYREKNYLAKDPTFKHAMQSQSPLVWSDSVFASTPDIWDEARSNGLHVGWAHPVRDSRNIVGLLTVARSDRPLLSSEISEKQAKLATLAQNMHQGIMRHLEPLYIPEAKEALSKREIDVLRWTAAGKTAAEISKILKITERTVNFHVNKVVDKLGVSNKTAAAVHAALLGLF